ncbi:uncharacterized mitochondrial protein-like protein [Tanacetum coccineum]
MMVTSLMVVVPTVVLVLVVPGVNGDHLCEMGVRGHSQSKHAHDILARAQLLEAKPLATPLSTSTYFTSHGIPYSDLTHYRSMFLHNPMQDHFWTFKRILRYVKGTISYGLSFSHAPSPTILSYSDADWARCIETRCSTYDHSIFLGGNLVSWSAKKQSTASRSSYASEYMALANTASKRVWVTHLFRELHVIPSRRPTILCDNRSALFLSQHHVSHKRAKHIDIDFHFVRELLQAATNGFRFIASNSSFTTIRKLTHHGILFLPIGHTLRSGMFRIDEAKGASSYGASRDCVVLGCDDPLTMCVVVESRRMAESENCLPQQPPQAQHDIN